MNIYDLSKISPYRIGINCRSFIRYVHHSRNLTVQGRARSAFMYVIEGTFHYQFKGGELTLEAGDILYLPEGGYYRYDLAGVRTECLQIEVEITVDGERAAFSDRPVKLTEDIAHMRYIMEDLERGSGEMERTAAVFLFLGNLLGKKHTLSSVSPRILPAVQYLETHCNEPVLMEDVATLCHLSQSQIRRLFRKELGMSPVEYKNSRRMEKACNMLCYTYNNISEIAVTLGFDNVYVFSRVFRKYIGVSPTQYRKNKI